MNQLYKDNSGVLNHQWGQCPHWWFKTHNSISRRSSDTRRSSWHPASVYE